MDPGRRGLVFLGVLSLNKSALKNRETQNTASFVGCSLLVWWLSYHGLWDARISQAWFPQLAALFAFGGSLCRHLSLKWSPFQHPPVAWTPSFQHPHLVARIRAKRHLAKCESALARDKTAHVESVSCNRPSLFGGLLRLEVKGNPTGRPPRSGH